MAKGSNTTRNSGASARSASATSTGSRVTVDSGYPQTTLDEAQRRLASLNAEFGFNPDVHFINTKQGMGGVHRTAAGHLDEENASIQIGTLATSTLNWGVTIDHEYGHLFYVPYKPNLRQAQNLLKLNAHNERASSALKEYISWGKGLKNNPNYSKWERLWSLYDHHKNSIGDAYAKKDIKEFCAEIFAGYRSGNPKVTSNKDFREAYKIITSLPKVNGSEKKMFGKR